MAGSRGPRAVMCFALVSCATPVGSPDVDYETSHQILVSAVTWTSPTQIEMTFENPFAFDLCVQSYQWPAPTPADDVLIIRDADGHTAPFVGDEPVVMGSYIKTIRTHERAHLEVDLQPAYDVSALHGDRSVEYRVSFHEC